MTDPTRAHRIEALQAMLDSDPDDTFALYGLALEHKAEDALDRAEPLLRRLLERDPGHHYGYYQLGELLIADDRPDEAHAILTAGITRARADGELKAAGELLALLDTL
ncbi:MAG: tetratricopeptide repeat protein [Myxococcales bacterium]|nr:tetratricopeptide repeat protein [Myxococcales bacterium]